MQSLMFLIIALTSMPPVYAAQQGCQNVISGELTTKLKDDFEAKLDPDVKKYEELGWGKKESVKVKELKAELRNDEALYAQLFMPSKFDLINLENYRQVANQEGQYELARFFGEMLRMMNEKQLKDQYKPILKIARTIGLGTGFLNGLHVTVNAGDRKFDWDAAGGDFKITISNKVDFGW